MGAQLAVAASLPALGLGAEALVALDVVGTGVAESLRHRETLFRVVLRHGNVSRATHADAKGRRGVGEITDGIRRTLRLALA